MNLCKLGRNIDWEKGNFVILILTGRSKVCDTNTIPMLLAVYELKAVRAFFREVEG